MPDGFWKDVCDVLHRRLDPDEFALWMSPLVVVGGELQDGRTLSNLFLRAENVYAAKWVKEHYAQHIDFAVGAVCTTKGWERPKVFYESLPNVLNKKERRTTQNQSLPYRQLKRNVRINPLLNFEAFIEGDSNRMAKLICLELAARKAGDENNLFVLCGNCGLGKTHLMHAVVNEMHKNKERRILFINAESFVMDLSDHIIRNDMSEFKRRYRSADILLIDDIHFFNGKKKTNEEFFHIVKALSEQNKKMVFSCDKPPQQLEGFSDAMQTRLAQGLVAVIEKPDLDLRAALLREKAKLAGFQLGSDCAEYIAQRVVRSVRDLEGALKIILFYARSQQRAIDVPLVREALKNIALPLFTPVTVEDIQKAVAAHYGLPLLQIKAAGRSRAAMIPRQMAIYLSRKLTKKSLAEIGAAFGGRNHTTVIHSCRSFENTIEDDSHIKYAFLSIQRSLMNQ